MMKIGCVLLASGTSQRFCGNKLLVSFHGKTLAENTMDAIPAELFYRTVVVTCHEQVQSFAKQRNFTTVWNEHPESGIAYSIECGLTLMHDADACMFCVCDQPYLNKESILSLVKSYNGGIHALSADGQRGNPVVFPRSLFFELSHLKKGQSGADVIRAHEDQLTLVPATSALELFDIDTKEDMAHLLGINNLFLTGEKDVGKSTLLEYALLASNISYTGFITRPYEINGTVAGHYFHSHSLLTPSIQNNKPISVRIDDSSCIPIARTFDLFGVPALQNSIQDSLPLLLMDELGTLENDAPFFKAAVEQCLTNKKPVLGSPKACESEWLQAIQSRPDTRVILLNQTNKDSVLQDVLAFIRQISIF